VESDDILSNTDDFKDRNATKKASEIKKNAYRVTKLKDAYVLSPVYSDGSFDVNDNLGKRQEVADIFGKELDDIKTQVIVVNRKSRDKHPELKTIDVVGNIIQAYINDSAIPVYEYLDRKFIDDAGRNAEYKDLVKVFNDIKAFEATHKVEGWFGNNERKDATDPKDTRTKAQAFMDLARAEKAPFLKDLGKESVADSVIIGDVITSSTDAELRNRELKYIESLKTRTVKEDAEHKEWIDNGWIPVLKTHGAANTYVLRNIVAVQAQPKGSSSTFTYYMTVDFNPATNDFQVEMFSPPTATNKGLKPSIRENAYVRIRAASLRGSDKELYFNNLIWSTVDENKGKRSILTQDDADIRNAVDSLQPDLTTLDQHLKDIAQSIVTAKMEIKQESKADQQFKKLIEANPHQNDKVIKGNMPIRVANRTVSKTDTTYNRVFYVSETQSKDFNIRQYLDDFMDGKMRHNVDASRVEAGDQKEINKLSSRSQSIRKTHVNLELPKAAKTESQEVVETPSAPVEQEGTSADRFSKFMEDHPDIESIQTNTSTLDAQDKKEAKANFSTAVDALTDDELKAQLKKTYPSLTSKAYEVLNNNEQRPTQEPIPLSEITEYMQTFLEDFNTEDIDWVHSAFLSGFPDAKEFGRFVNGMISFYTSDGNTDKVILHHEILHKIMAQYMNADERNALLNEIGTIPAYAEWLATTGKEDSALMREEFIARRFQSYTPTKPGLISYLKWLVNSAYNYVRKILKLKAPNQSNEDFLDNFFKDIHKGAYKSRLIANTSTYADRQMQIALNMFKSAEDDDVTALSQYVKAMTYLKQIAYDIKAERGDSNSFIGLNQKDIIEAISRKIFTDGQTDSDLAKQFWHFRLAQSSVLSSLIEQLAGQKPKIKTRAQVVKEDIDPDDMTITVSDLNVTHQAEDEDLVTVIENVPDANEAKETEAYSEMMDISIINQLDRLSKELKTAMELVKRSSSKEEVKFYSSSLVYATLLDNASILQTESLSDFIKALEDSQNAVLQDFADAFKSAYSDVNRSKSDFMYGFRYVVNGVEFILKGDTIDEKAKNLQTRIDKLGLKYKDLGYVYDTGNAEKLFEEIKKRISSARLKELVLKIKHEIASQVRMSPMVFQIEREPGSLESDAYTKLRTIKRNPYSETSRAKQYIKDAIDASIDTNKFDIRKMVKDFYKSLGITIEANQVTAITNAIKDFTTKYIAEGKNDSDLQGYLNNAAQALVTYSDYNSIRSYTDRKNRRIFLYNLTSFKNNVIGGILGLRKKVKFLGTNNIITRHSIFLGTPTVKERWRSTITDQAQFSAEERKNGYGKPIEYGDLTSPEFQLYNFFYGFLSYPTVSTSDDLGRKSYLQPVKTQSNRKLLDYVAISLMGLKDLKSVFAHNKAFEKEAKSDARFKPMLAKFKSFEAYKAHIVNYSKSNLIDLLKELPTSYNPFEIDAWKGFMSKEEGGIQSDYTAFTPDDAYINELMNAIKENDERYRPDKPSRIGDTSGTAGQIREQQMKEKLRTLAKLYTVYNLNFAVQGYQLDMLLQGKNILNPVQRVKRNGGLGSPFRMMHVGKDGALPVVNVAVMNDRPSVISASNDPSGRLQKMYDALGQPHDGTTYAIPYTFMDIRKGTGNPEIRFIVKNMYYGINTEGELHFIKTATFELTNEFARMFPAHRNLRLIMETNGMNEEDAKNHEELLDYIVENFDDNNELYDKATNGKEKEAFDKLRQYAESLDKNKHNMLHYQSFASAVKVGGENPAMVEADLQKPEHILQLDNEQMGMQGNPITTEGDLSKPSQFNYHLPIPVDSKGNLMNEVEAFNVYKDTAKLYNLYRTLFEQDTQLNELTGDDFTEAVKDVILPRFQSRDIDFNIYAAIKSKLPLDYPVLYNRVSLTLFNYLSKELIEFKFSGTKLINTPAYGVYYAVQPKKFIVKGAESKKVKGENTKVVFSSLKDLEDVDHRQQYKDFYNYPDYVRNAISDYFTYKEYEDSIDKDKRTDKTPAQFLESILNDYARTYAKADPQTEEDFKKSLTDAFTNHFYNDGELKDNVLPIRKLQLSDKNGFAEAVLPLTYVEQKVRSIPEFKNMTRAEIMRNKKSILNALNENFRIGIGVRIPSTGIHSSVPIRVVDIIENANNIILSEEIVARHGSDYDVDSLQFYRKERFSKKEKDALEAHKLTIKGNLKDAIDFVMDIDLEGLKNQITNAPDKATRKEKKDAFKLTFSIQSKVLKNQMLDNYLKITTALKNRKDMNTPISFEMITGVKKWNKDDIARLVEKFGIEDFGEVKDKPTKEQKEKLFDKSIPVTLRLSLLADMADPFPTMEDLNNSKDNATATEQNNLGRSGTGIYASSMSTYSYMLYGAAMELNGEALDMDDIMEMEYVNEDYDPEEHTYEAKVRIKKWSTGEFVEGTLTRKPVKVSGLDSVTVKLRNVENPIELNKLRYLSYDGNTATEIADTIVNGFIDNVKEQVTDKIFATDVVINAMALLNYMGMPLTGFIDLMMSQPIIRSVGKTRNTFRTVEAVAKHFIPNYDSNISLTDNLRNAIGLDKILDVKDMESVIETHKITDNYKAITDAKHIKTQLKALLLFMEAYQTAEKTIDVSSLINNLKGLKVKSWELARDINTYEKLKKGEGAFDMPNFTKIPSIKGTVQAMKYSLDISKKMSYWERLFNDGGFGKEAKDSIVDLVVKDLKYAPFSMSGYSPALQGRMDVYNGLLEYVMSYYSKDIEDITFDGKPVKDYVHLSVANKDYYKKEKGISIRLATKVGNLKQTGANAKQIFTDLLSMQIKKARSTNKENLFLNSLEIEETRSKHYYIKFNASLDDTAEKRAAMMKSYAELDTDLQRKLLKYASMSEISNTTFKGFMLYVPSESSTSYLGQTEIADALEELKIKLLDKNNLNNFIENFKLQFAINNAENMRSWGMFNKKEQKYKTTLKGKIKPPRYVATDFDGSVAIYMPVEVTNQSSPTYDDDVVKGSPLTEDLEDAVVKKSKSEAYTYTYAKIITGAKASGYLFNDAHLNTFDIPIAMDKETADEILKQIEKKESATFSKTMDVINGYIYKDVEKKITKFAVPLLYKQKVTLDTSGRKQTIDVTFTPIDTTEIIEKQGKAEDTINDCTI
jgi:hypothetical protein